MTHIAEQTIKDIFTLEDLRKLEAKLAGHLDKRPLYERVGGWIQRRAKQREEEGSPQVPVPDTVPFGRSNFGSRFEPEKYLNTLNEEEMLARCICHICADVASEPQITDCNHVFCKDCIQAECEKSAARGSDFTECPACDHAFSGIKPFEDLEARHDVGTPASQADDLAMEGGRGRRAKHDKDAWINLPGDMLPSAKTVAVKRQILEWQRDAPDDKLVIFTQFRLMARILGRVCQAEGWTFVYYTGEMNEKARHLVSRKFQSPDSGVKIMIAGLKCGGQGLNLTAANRVISIDLWWNHSVELQAFGRVFRIGQSKKTYLARIVVRNTVDDRLLSMQEEKIRIVDGAMMDDGRKVKPLTLEELASLFGCVSEDENGNTVILADEEDSDNDDADIADDDADVPAEDVRSSEAEGSPARKDGAELEEENTVEEAAPDGTDENTTEVAVTTSFQVTPAADSVSNAEKGFYLEPGLTGCPQSM
ncbi:MAG: hypothetical protein M1832_005505 [Thelocarpon impressellum]|nr:MAG: hypothetical protein M1832_005505 [Thelocarpon impressellum]